MEPPLSHPKNNANIDRDIACQGGKNANNALALDAKLHRQVGSR
jgi:hypothetical protein